MKSISITLVAGFAGLMLMQSVQLYGGAAEYKGYQQQLETAEKNIEAALADFGTRRSAGTLATGAAAGDLLDTMLDNWRVIERLLPLLSVKALQSKYKGRAYNMTLSGFPDILSWLQAMEARKTPTASNAFENILAKIQGAENSLSTAKRQKAVTAATTATKGPLAADLKTANDALTKVKTAIDGILAPIAGPATVPEYGPAMDLIKGNVDALKTALGAVDFGNTIVKARDLNQQIADSRNNLKKPGRLDSSAMAAVVNGPLPTAVDTLGFLYDAELKKRKTAEAALKPAEDAITDYKKKFLDLEKDMMTLANDPTTPIVHDDLKKAVQYYTADLRGKGLLGAALPI